jgi:hypothetical protein
LPKWFYVWTFLENPEEKKRNIFNWANLKWASIFINNLYHLHTLSPQATNDWPFVSMSIIVHYDLFYLWIIWINYKSEYNRFLLCLCESYFFPLLYSYYRLYYEARLFRKHNRKKKDITTYVRWRAKCELICMILVSSCCTWRTYTRNIDIYI